MFTVSAETVRDWSFYLWGVVVGILITVCWWCVRALNRQDKDRDG